MSSIEIRREGEVEFSKPLARALFRDSRLSFSARGLFAFLWDLPADWLIRSTWLATRGPDGKDAIRARLAELRAVGAMRIEPIRSADGKVAGTRWVLISPEKWAKAAPLSHSTESGISRLSAFPTVGEPATKVLQGVKVLQGAAARAPARTAADAAADSNEQKRRHPRRTANKIECWYPSDDTPANDIEALFPAEQVAAAVASIKARKNSRGKPTSPYPALVAEELERQRREHDAAERRAAEKAARDAESQSILPPEIQRERSAALKEAQRARAGRFNSKEVTA